jgi:hypothetical protein
VPLLEAVMIALHASQASSSCCFSEHRESDEIDYILAKELLYAVSYIYCVKITQVARPCDMLLQQETTTATTTADNNNDSSNNSSIGGTSSPQLQV